jgi:hypothetical protein
MTGNKWEEIREELLDIILKSVKGENLEVTELATHILQSFVFIEQSHGRRN